MKKRFLTLFILLGSLYVSGQERIFLSTGDTIIGTINKIDLDHSRITRTDGTSFLILSKMVRYSEYILTESEKTAKVIKDSIALERKNHVNTRSDSLLFYKHRIKTNPVNVLFNEVRLSYEFQFAKKNSIELQVGALHRNFLLSGVTGGFFLKPKIFNKLLIHNMEPE